MDLGFTSQLKQVDFLNALASSPTGLEDLHLHLFSASGTINSRTALASLTECVFPGYTVQIGQSPESAFIDTDGSVKAGYPDVTFIASAGAMQQVVTVLAGTVGTSGNATVTVTAAGLTGSPKAVTVAVLLGDTPAVVAGKVAVALAADTDVGAFFTVTVNGTAVYLTAKTAAANDPTMNVAVANGTSAGIVPSPTSYKTRTGFAPTAPINDQIKGWFMTDPSDTVLVAVGQLAGTVPITGPSQGALVSPGIAWGS